jgi:hypothetical protein
MTDAQRISKLEQQVAALINENKYTNNAIMNANGIAANNNRYTNDFIGLFLPYLPLIAKLNIPLESGVAVSTLTCSATNYKVDNNDKFVLINIATGTSFNLVANGNTAAGSTSIVFDSFTPTEEIGTNSLIMFKMHRDTGSHFIKIDS